MPEETMGDHMKLALDAIFGEGFRDKFGELGKTNAEKGDDDDLYKKGQLENAKKLADKEANQKFTHGEGGMALDKQAKELGGDFKGAKEIQMKIDRQREYNRLRKEGASEEQANQGADMKIEQERRQEAQKFGHLVNARSGAGDIAAAAKLAENATHAQGHAATASAVRDLHKSMDRNHGEGMAQYQNHTRKRF
jgi:hypothetical protein